ncbi:hypothetical protein CPR19088_GLDEOEPO_02336 [Companilactobacillus paralimentarius]|nr:hypothetical protein LNA01_24200 [Companilactobacillus nantensis]
MAAELVIIVTWIVMWIIVSFFISMFIKVYQLIVPAKKYVNRPGFFKQWIRIFLIIPMFMP